MSARLLLSLALALPLAGLAPAARAAATLRIAAASDLVFCLPALNAAFRRHHPTTDLIVSTGSSGNYYAQIRRGAPFDVFLAADMFYPQELIAAGAADAASLTPYALGRIVLWTLRDDLDLDAGPAALLRDPRVRRLAIAQPQHAPYGRAARETLIHAGVWDDAQPKLIFGENISQAAQFVQTRHADLGLVALSLVLAPQLRDQGRHRIIPAEWHEPLLQAAVLTRRGVANPLARAYLDFLRSPAAREIFEAYGFTLPPRN